MLRSATEVVPEAVELGAALPDVHAVLLRTASLDAEAIERARSLRVIARHGVGVDNVAVDVAARRGIPVLITPQANLRSVAEHVFALALAVSRNLILADHTVRGGRSPLRDRLIGRELSGATLGVIGLGRIGGRWPAWPPGASGCGCSATTPGCPPARSARGTPSRWRRSRICCAPATSSPCTSALRADPWSARPPRAGFDEAGVNPDPDFPRRGGR